MLEYVIMYSVRYVNSPFSKVNKDFTSFRIIKYVQYVKKNSEKYGMEFSEQLAPLQWPECN